MQKGGYILVLLFFLGLSLQGQGQNSTISENQMATEKVKVFPNPATTVLNVLGLTNAERANIAVTDQYGNVVLHHQWTIRNNALNLPVAQLQEGIHILSIQSEEQTVQLKFYKQ